MSGRVALVACITAIALGASSRSASAQADTYYKCIDENGKPLMTNVGNTKNCTKVSVDPVVIPKSVNTPRSTASSPSTFPKVDGATQKGRDNDRRRILEDELHDKEARLADLKREYNNGEPERQGGERNYQRYLDRTARLKDDIARAESDIASIRGELGKVQ